MRRFFTNVSDILSRKLLLQIFNNNIIGSNINVSLLNKNQIYSLSFKRWI